jgi:hypothetical protein
MGANSPHEKNENCTQNFNRKPKGKRPFGRARRRLEDDIKMDLTETEGVAWIQLVQDRVQCLAVVNTVANRHVS